MPDIFVIDDQHPEDLAMLQALYSRSPASVVDHLERLKKSDSGKFMDQYYVGYGHASIGDCGATTVFIEQVSMLVAKAVQDNPLYNGQEASTRYLDFSKQAVIDPYDNPASAAVQARWMEIYNRVLPLLAEGLKKRYPFDAGEYKNEKIWSNALYARAFDIARSLLPIGTTTLLSWTTSLRAARDHLRRLKYHPLPEVREVAKKIFAAILEKYPHSFNKTDMDDEGSPRDAYAQKFSMRNHFVSAGDLQRQFGLTPDERESIASGNIVARADSVDLVSLRNNEAETLSLRPQHAALPWRLEAYGRYNFLFLLDFGSFRDIQRHRNGVCQIPLIDGQFGLNPWYMQQFKEHLSPADAQQLEQDIAAQREAIADLPKRGVAVKPELSQYLFPMGTQALVHASYSVPETIYVGELRSGKMVHPSLRPIAQKMLAVLEHDLPGIALHGDRDEDSWSAKRGEQTISSKVA
ncbi:MAG: FAD-dependent thymidylate synthase [Alphaproteobacteria bacterium]|nr:FAD-dependent thymidylate synthase [Alphaproteobacteria bacterium]